MRNPDALEQLNKLLTEKKNTPFEWGTWDCCIFGADCILAMTGEDKLHEFRNKYNSRHSAALALREIGSGTLDKTLKEHLGPSVGGARAWRGDIVFHKNNVGVCVGSQAYFIGEDGLELTPMSEITKVYRIR